MSAPQSPCHRKLDFYYLLVGLGRPAPKPQRCVSFVNRAQGTSRVRLGGRKEARVPARIEVHIRKADGSNLGEILFTENISSTGAGLFTASSWNPGEMVLLKALRLSFVAQGRIVYSRRMPAGKFTVGVAVLAREGNWLK